MLNDTDSGFDFATPAATTLNPRQLLFAQSVVTGMSLTDAYREAGYTGAGHVAHAGASKLMAKPAIAAYVAARQQQHTLSAVADRTEILKKLTGVLRSESDDLDSLPVHEVTRRTTLKSDGTLFTLVRSKSMSRHAALRQLARMLGLTTTTRPDPAQEQVERHRQHCIAAARATVAAAIGATSAHACPATVTAYPASPSHLVLLHPDDPGLDTPFGQPIQIGRHLNARQRLFCEHLARDIPARSAYGLAGYQVSPGNPGHASAAASRLLKRPAVIAYLRELRWYPATLGQDPAGDLADRAETLAYLTQALRAKRQDIESQGRFIDQVVRDEVEKPDGDREIRTVVRSISQPRIIAQLAAILSPSAGTLSAHSHATALPDAQYAAEIRAELEELITPDLLP
ncbi:MAG: terminase small subunit, partial [Akkermansiaceae bacterium]|nr:terminase small subunit [Akkermansiaceae bacterium]